MNFDRHEQLRIMVMRQTRPHEYIELLESLLLEAEDIAISIGHGGLNECTDSTGRHYQSATCWAVITNIREKRTALASRPSHGGNKP